MNQATDPNEIHEKVQQMTAINRQQLAHIAEQEMRNQRCRNRHGLRLAASSNAHPFTHTTPR